MRSEPALILLAGCAQSPVPAATDSAGAAEAGRPDPLITSVTLSCDAADAAWSLEVLADAWTGGGNLWMARDTSRVERHRVPSVAAEADGSGDRLSLGLTVVADWRYQVSGSSTAWRCADAEELSFLVAIYTTDGDGRADCRTWGRDPTLWERTEDVTACDTVLEQEDTGSGD